MIIVHVPYDKSNEGEVLFSLEWQKGIKASSFGPHEGDCFEVVETMGFYFDDDYPDLEQQAFALGADILDSQYD